MIIAGLIGALIAIIGTVLAMNFMSAEKEIQKSLEHRYGVGDPQFRRELGIMLGPAIIDGNRIENLELWVRPQSNGIRALDAVRWARMILARYEDLAPPPTTLTLEG
jgi:hypothetical protein